jgi:hypothetical protein
MLYMLNKQIENIFVSKTKLWVKKAKTTVRT